MPVAEAPLAFASQRHSSTPRISSSRRLECGAWSTCTRGTNYLAFLQLMQKPARACMRKLTKTVWPESYRLKHVLFRSDEPGTRRLPNTALQTDERCAAVSTNCKVTLA